MIKKIFLASIVAYSGIVLADLPSSQRLEQCQPDLTLSERQAAKSIGKTIEVSEYAPLVQPVVFHIIHKKDGTGKVSFPPLVEQIAQLNRAFSGSEATAAKYGKKTDSEIRFELHGVKVYESDQDHDLCALPSQITKFRPANMLDPSRYMNVYICWVEWQYGVAWLPYQSWFRQPLSEKHFSLGVILHWDILPGNNFNDGIWKQGDMLTHEAGHHFGLMHPYEGDCYGDESNSDMIIDTPRQTGNPAGTCALKGKRDSCKNQPGKDDVENYMGIFVDTCRSHFTPGQVAFMRKTIDTYKPTLVKQLPVDCVAAVDSTDTSPDLLPCTGALQFNKEKNRYFCPTSITNSKQWGWACCPAKDGSGSGENSCRSYDPKKVNIYGTTPL